MLGLESNIASESGPSSKFGFSPTIAYSCCTWVDFALFWHWCSVAGGCVLLQGDRVKVEEGLQISVVGHCCLFWKCFSICGSIRVSSSFLPPPCGLLEAAQEFPPFAPPWHTQVLAYTSLGIHKGSKPPWHTQVQNKSLTIMSFSMNIDVYANL